MSKFYVIAFLILALLIIGGCTAYEFGTVKVDDYAIEKTIIDSGTTFFSVLKSDGTKEVFANEDNILFLKFNSNDILRDIDIGGIYTLKVNGIRIPFFSMFRNIISIEKDWSK